MGLGVNFFAIGFAIFGFATCSCWNALFSLRESNPALTAVPANMLAAIMVSYVSHTGPVKW